MRLSDGGNVHSSLTGILSGKQNKTSRMALKVQVMDVIGEPPRFCCRYSLRETSAVRFMVLAIFPDMTLVGENEGIKENGATQ